MSKPRSQIIEIDCEGVLRFVWDDSLAELMAEGNGRIERASHIEPRGAEWFVDLRPLKGPVRGGFLLRSDAIAFELDWIREKLGL